MVKTSPSNSGGVGSIPSCGAKIPQASRPKTKTLIRSNVVTNSIKTFKKVTLSTHMCPLFCPTWTSLLSSWEVLTPLNGFSNDLATHHIANDGTENYTTGNYSKSRLRISSRWLSFIK